MILANVVCTPIRFQRGNIAADKRTLIAFGWSYDDTQAVIGMTIAKARRRPGRPAH